MASITIERDSGAAERKTTGEISASYEIEYRVVLDDYRASSRDALNATDPNNGLWIPRPGEFFVFGTSSDPTAFCQSANAERINFTNSGGALYSVVVKYANAEAETTEEREPLESDPFSFGTSYSTKRLPFDVDLNGKIVRNAVGDPYNPTPEIEIDVPRFAIRRVEYRNPLRFARQYTSFINATEIWGFPARTLKLLIAPDFDGTKWTVVYNIEYDPNGYQPAILERGFRYYESPPTPEIEPTPNPDETPETSTSSATDEETETETPVEPTVPKLVRALGDDGEPTDDPVLLAADGTKLAADAEPIFTEYAAYWEVDFSIFNLPDIAKRRSAYQ